MEVEDESREENEEERAADEAVDEAVDEVANEQPKSGRADSFTVLMRSKEVSRDEL